MYKINIDMKDWIESKFKLDYTKLREIPEQLSRNLDIILSKDRKIARIAELAQQIEMLKYDLESDSLQFAYDLLKNNFYPRFSGYEEFSSLYLGETPPYDSEGYKTFAQIISSYCNTKNTDPEWKKVSELAKFSLENFIWLFFSGGKLNKIDYIIDFINQEVSHGHPNDIFPGYISYEFFVNNPKSGNSYDVTFIFYDIKTALKNASEEYSLSQDRRNYPRYVQIHACDFGKISVQMSKMMKTPIFMDYNSNSGFRDGKLKVSNEVHVFKSYDPLAISTWICNMVKNDLKEEE